MTSSPVASTPAWQALLPAALVGTERSPVPDLVLTDPALAPLQQLLAAVPHDGDSALGLLRRVGALTLCAQAGEQGQPWPQPPGAAPAERRPALSSQPALAPQVAALERALRDGPQRLLVQMLHTLHVRGWRLPPALLPLALEQARRASVLRGPMQPVLGERGRWLAGLNEAWRFALGADDQAPDSTVWAEGTLAQRGAVLRRQRQHDAAAGRARLEAALGELPAKERAELLAELAWGLGADDLPLLERLGREDRSREVRDTARGLLLRLADSDWSRRNAARAATLLSEARGFLGRRWTIEPPTELPADWKADGLDAERPKTETQLGERGWWLMRLVSQVPPPWWSAHTGMTPTELLAWSAKTPWAQALQRGWCAALLAAPDAALALALLQAGSEALSHTDPVALLTVLPLAAREQFWLTQLQHPPGRGLLRALGLGSGSHEISALTQWLPHILSACPPDEHLGLAVSQQLLALLPDTLMTLAARNSYWQSHWRGPWTELACVLHPSSLPVLLTLAATYPDLAPAAGAAADRQLWMQLPPAPV